MAHRPTHLAVRTAIGAELRRLHADLLESPVPEQMAELLRALDQAAQGGGNDAGGDAGGSEK